MGPLKGKQSVYYGSSDIPVIAKFCLPVHTFVKFSEVDKRSVFGKGNEFHATLKPYDLVRQIF